MAGVRDRSSVNPEAAPRCFLTSLKRIDRLRRLRAVRCGSLHEPLASNACPFLVGLPTIVKTYVFFSLGPDSGPGEPCVATQRPL
jgi:hypothetical protein